MMLSTFQAPAPAAAAKAFNPEQLDPKAALSQFCQKYLHRSITKEDIVYNSVKFPQGVQATVKVNCLEGQEFAGELVPDVKNVKEAERQAARQALSAFQDKIAEMQATPATSSKKKKRTASEAGLTLGVPNAATGETAGQVAKRDLNSACSKIIRRVMSKDDIVYESQAVAVDGGAGFQATVRCPCLPNDWAEIVWTGEACAQKKDAEQSAAASALSTVLADPELMALVNRPPKPSTWNPSKGKGKGKGKPNHQAPPMHGMQGLGIAGGGGGFSYDPNMYQALLGMTTGFSMAPQP